MGVRETAEEVAEEARSVEETVAPSSGGGALYVLAYLSYGLPSASCEDCESKEHPLGLADGS